MLRVLCKISVLLALGLSLAACGFQLRGSAEPGSVSIEQEFNFKQRDSNAFNQRLARELRARGAVFSGQGLALSLGATQHSRFGIAFDSNGNALEYQLTASIALTLDLGPEQGFDKQSFSVSRNYQFQNTSLLASQAQERAIRTELEDALARQVLEYLSRRF